MRLRTLTVRELIDRLEGEDPDARVLFTVDYGDYHHTPQALPIEGEFEEGYIEKSAYSNSGFALVQDEERIEDLLAGAEGPNAITDKFLVIR